MNPVKKTLLIGFSVLVLEFFTLPTNMGRNSLWVMGGTLIVMIVLMLIFKKKIKDKRKR